MFAIGTKTKLLVAIGFALGILLDCSPAIGQGSSLDEPPTNLVLIDIEKGFQVISLPEPEAKNSELQIRSVPTKRYPYGRPVGVFGGHLLSLNNGRGGYSPHFSGKLFATDLNDGTVRVLVSENVVKAKCVSGELYLIAKLPKKTKEHTHKLVHIDLETLQSTDVCNLQSDASMMGGPDFSLEVSPDGQTAAVSEMKPVSRLTATADITARVVFAKAGQTETTTTPYEFRAITIGTGAGFFMKAPVFTWLDNSRLLYGGYSTDGSEFFHGKGVRLLPKGGEVKKVSLIQADDGTVSDLCELPKRSFPTFVAAGKNHATIHLGKIGLHVLNIETGELKEANSVGSFELERSKKDPKEPKPVPLTSEAVAGLHEKGWLLFGPQRQRLAWLSEVSEGSKGPSGKLNLYHINGRHQLIYKGRVASVSATVIAPPMTFVAWASAAEMEPSQKLMNLEEFKKPKIARKDTRPDVNDCLEITIKADKEVYLRHAPVKLVITAKNVTDKTYRFKKNRVESSRPFQLENKHPRGRSTVHLFDPDENKLEGDFLELPPGETVEFHRTYEVDKTGPQRFELEAINWGIWKGSLKKDVHFKVLEETAPELLKQKFDRILATCLNRWKRTEGKLSIQPSRFWQLGDEGADLLVDFLNQCDNDALKNELTDGLRSSLSDSTVEYLEKRLETDLKIDASNVVRCVASMVSRAKWKRNADKFEKARKLLLAAGKHRNPKAKFAAVLSMHELPDDLDQFMLETVKDNSDNTATEAARYIAVRQQLPLKSWLEYARNHKNRATELALNSFAKKLASQWSHELDVKDGEPGLKSSYEQTIAKLVEWCEKHPKVAARFFDELSLRSNRYQPLPGNKQGDPIVLPD